IVSMIVALTALSHGTNSQHTTPTATAHANASGTAGAINQAPTNVSATHQAQASATAGVVLTATSSTPIFADPLSSNTNGWSDDGTKCAFTNGTYHVLVQQTNFLQLCESSAFSMNNDAI